MDFDEYEYLEKTVENPEPQKLKESANGEDKDRSRSSKHKSEEKTGDDEDSHRSKRSKFGDDRGSSRRRSRSREGERDRHRSSRERKDREERNGREKRDRDRDRDPDRDRRERDRDSDRDKERDRERHHESDRDREDREQSRRSQSRSRSDRHRSDLDERDGGRSRDREFREKEKDKDLKERDRESRRHKEKKEEATEPEADPERDQRTVFAYQISLKAGERDIYEFFSRAGKVRDVRLIMDRISRRSKGVGYVEFYDVMSVPMAIALSGQPLMGQPVMVKPSEAEKNLVQSTASAAGSGSQVGPYSGGARRLYVGNLHVNITEDQLRQVFEAFGAIELVQLPRDETGHCKGYGFVQFSRLEDARNALNLNGQLNIGGQVIKVSTVTDQTGAQDVAANTGDFDDDEGGGLPLNSHSRALLMAKLDRSGTASSFTSSVANPVVTTPSLSMPTAPSLSTVPAVSPLVPPILPASLSALGNVAAVQQLPTMNIPTIDTIGIPSECLLLKNMFDPNSETEPDFDLDIKEDVQEECSKFGKLKHIYVDRNSSGHVYLRFENAQASISAQRNLHGRWFAGKMITATFMVPQTYEAQFPESNR